MDGVRFNAIIDILREEFPHGHPGFIPFLIDTMDLHSRKNYGYAHGGDPLGNFDRRAVILGLYPNLDDSDPAVVAAKDILKQLDAALWQMNIGHTDEEETIVKRFTDVLVYAGLVIMKIQDQEKAKWGKTIVTDDDGEIN